MSRGVARDIGRLNRLQCGAVRSVVAMHFTNDTLRLHVADDGDPSLPPILLLHGITSFGGTWDWLTPTLAERFRVIRLDFRGHGDSDRAPDAYTSSGYVSDAVAALQLVRGVRAR